MRSNQDQQIALFDGERIAPGYRGRRSNLRIATWVQDPVAIAFAVALIGFATAAAAITVRHSSQSERSISAGGNLGGVPGAGDLKQRFIEAAAEAIPMEQISK
jgi:hypothetical protein